MQTLPLLYSTIWSQVVNYFRYRVIKEQVLLDCIVLFSFLILFLVAFILYYLFRRSGRAKRKILLQKIFNDFIGEVAVAESEEELNKTFLSPHTQKTIRQFQKEKYQKRLLISELAQTSKNFRGSTFENIQWLFQKMNLNVELLKDLKSPEWNIKARTIQQLGWLGQVQYVPEIFPLTNDENHLVRMEAQIAIVKLTGFSGLDFLNHANHLISEWQQLRLLQELSGQPIEENIDISTWLLSKNNSVVRFALRLIEIFRQYQYYDQVTNCLSHPSPEICKTAVAALSFISNEKTGDVFIEHFPDYESSTQLEILKFIEKEGNENHLSFLVSLLDHPDDAFKMAAAAAIRKIKISGMEKIELLVEKSSHPWNVILPQLKMEKIA